MVKGLEEFLKTYGKGAGRVSKNMEKGLEEFLKTYGKGAGRVSKNIWKRGWKSF